MSYVGAKATWAARVGRASLGGWLWLGACASEPEAIDSRPVDEGNPDGDNFAGATDVRITSPGPNDAVPAVFPLGFALGEAIDEFRVQIDAGELSPFVRADAEGTFPLSVLPGRHTVTLVGYDDDRVEIGRDALPVNAVGDAGSSWVAITSPSSGGSPVNPVQFTVSASDDVDAVTLFADGFEIGEVAPGGVLTRRFEGTGYEREIVAVGSDGGADVAEDTIRITVQAGTDVDIGDMNDRVMKLVLGYPTDSSISYWWPKGVDWSGSTRDILYRSELVADDGGVERCFCVGMTWEVYLRAWLEVDAERGGDGDDLHGLSVDDVLELRDDWYVRMLDGPGAAYALDRWGLGVEVESFDDWRAGDFVQFWRTDGSGHNVIFVDWVTNDAGDRTGIRYWSCNGASSTDGPGYNEEYFGTFRGAIDPSLATAGRAALPEDWF